MFGPEFHGDRIARPLHELEIVADLRPVIGRAEQIHVLDRVFCKLARSLEVKTEGSTPLATAAGFRNRRSRPQASERCKRHG